MRAVALVLDVCFVIAAFGIRTVVQWRRTGDPGWRLGRPHSAAELIARSALFVAAALLVVALVAADTVSIADAPVTAFAGVVVAVAAVVFVLAAQLHMGESWRIGVDPTERTALVQTGFYRWIRNPIYTGMIVFAVGQALMIPGVWSVCAVVAMLVGVEVQVRSVEEPYLRTTHGSGYDHWAARAGRFVPVVGRG